MFTDEDFQLVKCAGERVDIALDSEDPWALLAEVRAMLAPLVARGMPEALFATSCFALPDEFPSGAEFAEWRLALLRRAAEAEYPPAQFELGKAYDGGVLGDNPEISADWFRLAAQRGHAHAQWVHGLNLLAGRGQSPDSYAAYEWIRRAAEGRFIGAMDFLADAYATGLHGFPLDDERARYWREQSGREDAIGF